MKYTVISLAGTRVHSIQSLNFCPTSEDISTMLNTPVTSVTVLDTDGQEYMHMEQPVKLYVFIQACEGDLGCVHFLSHQVYAKDADEAYDLGFQWFDENHPNVEPINSYVHEVII